MVARGGGEETEETGSRSEGASQLAHTSPLERPREGKRGPGTGNLLLYTRPEIRMYHSRTHVGARARVHERPVVGLIHTGPIAKTTTESPYIWRKSIYDIRTGYARLSYRRTSTSGTEHDSNDQSSEVEETFWWWVVTNRATGPNVPTRADYAMTYGRITGRLMARRDEFP